MQTQLLLVAGYTLGLASALLRNMGPCSVNVESQTDFDLDEFASEKSGIWSFKLVPHVELYNDVDWMFLSDDPIADSGVYQTAIYYQRVDSEPDVMNQLILFDLGDGVVEAKPVYANITSDYKFFFLSYKPGQYAYFYVCSDVGGDNNVDYRFVLSHGKLTNQQKSEIKDLEGDFNFKGNLRYLTEGQTNSGRSVRGH